ncbi:unnamed protein product [Paramecium sonneborni]|uniref:Uncharacterized protein n=1 Tax=Paramecium sonneborni TaxID=65129 RepID=A0A8S1KDX6_9CILI|nr:unnamed protein product [Paramecium sonneborni]
MKKLPYSYQELNIFDNKYIIKQQLSSESFRIVFLPIHQITKEEMMTVKLEKEQQQTLDQQAYYMVSKESLNFIDLEVNNTTIQWQLKFQTKIQANMQKLRNNYQQKLVYNYQNTLQQQNQIYSQLRNRSKRFQNKKCYNGQNQICINLFN